MLRNIVLLLLGATSIIEAAPAVAPNVGLSTCTEPLIRKEWRNLKASEKKDYLDAVVCLTKKPGTYKNVYPGLEQLTRFEDFLYVHKVLAPYVHFVGHFLPWHRMMVHLYEKALREECNYKGAQPYWDPTLDVTSILSSPVFSPTTGFGGDGLPIEPQPPQPFPYPGGNGGGCVPDGPFSNTTIRIALNSTALREDHCITRTVSQGMAEIWATSSVVSKILNETDYTSMQQDLEGGSTLTNIGIHGGVHLMIGGTVADTYTSPGDPLFYLHHANMDRLWWKWQGMDKSGKRWAEMAGSPIPYANILEYELDMIKDRTNTTVESTMDLMDLYKNGEGVKIKEVMETTKRALCYVYE